jgi:hypothetical protein
MKNKALYIAVCAVVGAGGLIFARHESAFVLDSSERLSLHDAIADCASTDVACLVAESKKEANAQALSAAKSPEAGVAGSSKSEPCISERDAMEKLLAGAWSMGRVQPDNVVGKTFTADAECAVGYWNVDPGQPPHLPKGFQSVEDTSKYVSPIFQSVLDDNDPNAEADFFLTAATATVVVQSDVKVAVYVPGKSIEDLQLLSRGSNGKTKLIPSRLKFTDICTVGGTPGQWRYIVQLKRQGAPDQSLLASNGGAGPCTPRK